MNAFTPLPGMHHRSADSSTVTRDRPEIRISVVIPTVARSGLLERAVRSALSQTLPPLEIVVIVDGAEPDAATLAYLGSLRDERIRHVVAGRRLGNADARNRGVQEAFGDFIAFLDDDDIWMSEKLAVQCELLPTGAATDEPTAEASGIPQRPVPIISCTLIARDHEREFRWPRLQPGRQEPLSDYLFCRRWPMTGDRLVQTSTLLVPRWLCIAVRFRRGKRFVDQDWLLRCAHRGDVRLHFPQSRTPLVVWDMAQDRKRVTHYRNWRWSVAWIRHRQALVSRRAFAAFLLTHASASAADAGQSDAFWPILREAFRYGRPNLSECASHGLNFLLSRSMRDRLASALNRIPGLY